MNISSITSPSLWGKQVGGKYDDILGFTLYTEYINNNYVQYTDIFGLSIKPPTWTENIVEGLNINLNYLTNMLSVSEQPLEL